MSHLFDFCQLLDAPSGGKLAKHTVKILEIHVIDHGPKVDFRSRGRIQWLHRDSHGDLK